MIRECSMTGKTVEDATALALAELGLAEEEVTIEVIDLPQKKLFKTIPAKVRVTCDADVAAEAKKTVAAPVPVAPIAEKPTASAIAPKAPHKDTAPRYDAPEVEIDLAQNPKIADAVEYLTDLCLKMGTGDITVTAVQQGEAIILKVNGESAGNLIGHRGEVMEALSYLTSLVANRNGGDYTKIGLDINHYRSKREANLTALARRIAIKVAKTGRSHTLEPMNPYERRIIHSAVGEVEGVKSESTGEGANRRVVIVNTGANAQTTSDRPFRQAGRGGNNRGPAPSGGTFNKGGAGRPPRAEGEYAPKSNVPVREFADKPRDASATPSMPKRTETINDGGNMPLYGKIEL